MRGRLVLLNKKKKKKKKEFQTFNILDFQFEMWGLVYLWHIVLAHNLAQESQSVTPSLRLLQVFSKDISQTLDTWLADFRAEISGEVCVSLCLFFF